MRNWSSFLRQQEGQNHLAGQSQNLEHEKTIKHAMWVPWDCVVDDAVGMVHVTWVLKNSPFLGNLLGKAQ